MQMRRARASTNVEQLMVPTLSERLHAQGLLLVLVQLVLVLVRRARASTNVEQLALQHGNTN